MATASPRTSPSVDSSNPSIPLRVLFVTTTYPLTPGDSIPSFVADLAQALVRDHAIEVRVIAPHHAGAARRETVHDVEMHSPERRAVAQPRLLRRELECVDISNVVAGIHVPQSLKALDQERRPDEQD